MVELFISGTFHGTFKSKIDSFPSVDTIKSPLRLFLDFFE